MKYNPCPLSTRRQWGAGDYPVGSIPMGVRGDSAGVFWIPNPMRWSVGMSGVLSSCDQAETQKGVLQAIRQDHGWEVCGAIRVSRRTWEGWEQGRQIPAEKVMLLHDLIFNPKNAT